MMEKGKVLVNPTSCGFWFVCKSDQKELGRYGLTEEQAVTRVKESFPELKGNEAEEEEIKKIF